MGFKGSRAAHSVCASSTSRDAWDAHSVGHTTTPLVVLPSPTRCCCRAGKKSKEEAERAAVEEEALNKVTVELEAGALQNSVTWGWW